MTTEVKVFANHGWPVDVLPISINGLAVGGQVRVPAGETRGFCVHSGQDLLIHEVQPHETADGVADVAHSIALLAGTVNGFEKRLLEFMDVLKTEPGVVDQRWLAIARTQLELGFLALRRALPPAEDCR